MAYPILGLHHVTATVDDAQADLDFFEHTLGLRLVKKTVNFDNHHVYHFYYGDAHGTPGTIWTTFPYKDKGVRVLYDEPRVLLLKRLKPPAGLWENPGGMLEPGEDFATCARRETFEETGLDAEPHRHRVDSLRVRRRRQEPHALLDHAIEQR